MAELGPSAPVIPPDIYRDANSGVTGGTGGCQNDNPDSNVHGANMGPIWVQQDPGGPHVGPMNLAIWEPVPSVITKLVLCRLSIFSVYPNITNHSKPACIFRGLFCRYSMVPEVHTTSATLSMTPDKSSNSEMTSTLSWNPIFRPVVWDAGWCILWRHFRMRVSLRLFTRLFRLTNIWWHTKAPHY